MDTLHRHNTKKMSDGIRPTKIRKKRNAYTSQKENTHSFSAVEIQQEKPRIKKQKREQRQKISRPIQRKKAVQRKRKKTTHFSFFKEHRKIFLWSFFIALYLIVLFLIFNTLEKTDIQLIPKVVHIKETSKVVAYTDPSYGQLGVHIISLKNTLSTKVDAKEPQEFEEKAHGTITIFNNYSTEPQRLAPHTRFQSVSGKVFLLGDKGVEIPGKHNGKAGSVQASVYAEKAGPEYNIDVTDFSIPGFKEAGLDDKYQNIYALSLKKFSGGFRGTRLVVGETQKKEAVKALEAQLKDALSQKLLAEKTDRVLLVQDSIQLAYQKPIIDGDTIKETAQIFALLIEKKELEKFLKKKYVPKALPQDVFIKDFNGITFYYKGTNNLDFKNLEKVSLSFDVNIDFVWNIDTELVRNALVGLAKDDVPTVLREFEEIQKAKIHIFPFWQKHISDEKEHIFIEVL